MRRENVIHWIAMGALAGMCLMAPAAVCLAAASLGGLEQAATWILGSELVAPGLLAGAAAVLFLIHQTLYPWRWKS